MAPKHDRNHPSSLTTKQKRIVTLLIEHFKGDASKVKRAALKKAAASLTSAQAAPAWITRNKNVRLKDERAMYDLTVLDKLPVVDEETKPVKESAAPKKKEKEPKPEKVAAAKKKSVPPKKKSVAPKKVEESVSLPKEKKLKKKTSMAPTVPPQISIPSAVIEDGIDSDDTFDEPEIADIGE